MGRSTNRGTVQILCCVLNLMPSIILLANASSDQPTKLVVAIRVESNPEFTPYFVESLRRQVRDQLQNSFGGLFDFNVLTKGHRLIDDFTDQPIDEPRLNSESVSEFQYDPSPIVLIGLSQRRSRYHIAGRILSGDRGEFGTVGSSATPDRQWIVRGICLEVKRRLPVLALVKPSANPDVVQIEFPAHYDRSQLQAVLGEECIFQPYAIIRRRSGEIVRQKISLTYIHARKQTAAGFADVASGISNVWMKRPGLVAFEAIRIDTQSGRIRVQILQKGTDTSLQDYLVSANDESFAEHADSDILDRPDRRGVVNSGRLFRHLAYVRISQGGGTVFKVPVPITAEVSEQVIRIAADPLSRRKTEFDRELKFLVQDLQAITGLQEEAVVQTNKLNAERQHDQALSKSTSAVEDIDPQLAIVQRRLSELQRTAVELEIKSMAIWEFAEDQLKKLNKRQAELNQIRDALRIANESRKQQDRANVEIKLAQQLELDGNIERAIGQYEAALALQPNQPELQKLIVRLKDVWRIKSPEHEAARARVYNDWPRIDITDIKEQLPAIKISFQTIQDVDDYLTARKLAAITGDHLVELQAFVEQASNRPDEQDRKESEQYAQVLEELAAFQERVAQFVASRL